MKLKMRALPRINLFCVGTKSRKNGRNCDARYSCNNQQMKIYIPLHLLKGAGFSAMVYLFFNPNIDGETCTAKWVIFSSVL